MGCDDDETQGTFDTTDCIVELALEPSDCIMLAAIAASHATTAGQMFALLLGPIKGELLLDNTLSAELDALRLMDSSLDDDFKSLSRSSSLKIYKRILNVESLLQKINSVYAIIF